MEKLKARHLVRKASSEELARPGDYCLVGRLPVSEGREIPGEKIIMMCPFCGMAMASTFQKIAHSRSWWRRLCGLPATISADVMLQCVYGYSHKFLIKNGKVKAL